MRFSDKCWLVIAIPGFLLSFPTTAFSGEKKLRERFFSEAPIGWSKLQAAIAHLDGIALEERHSFKTNQGHLQTIKKESYIWKFARNEDKLRFEVTHQSKENEDLGTLAGGVNSKYHFFVRKENPSGSFLLERIGFDEPPMSLKHPHLYAWGVGFLKYLEAPWTVGGIPLPMMIEEKGFKLKKIEEVMENKTPLVKVTFSYSPPKKVIQKDKKGPMVVSPHDSPIRGGWMLFNANEFWSLVEYEVEVPAGPGKSYCSIVYDKNVEGIPLAKKVVLKDLGNNGDGSSNTYEFQTLNLSEFPESEFTLSTYGLPEPQGVEWPNKGPAWYLWAFGIGVLSLVLAVVTRNLIRRRAKKQR